MACSWVDADGADGHALWDRQEVAGHQILDTMGYQKNMQLEDLDQVYESVDAYVCPNCVTDDILRNSIQGAIESEPCSYCGTEQSAPISVVLDAILDVIQAEYTDPVEQLPWDGRDGGFQGAVIDGDDVVHALDEWTECDELLEDVANAFASSQWTENDYYGFGRAGPLSYGWSDFVGQVRSSTRFLVLQELGDEDHNPQAIPPCRMLIALGELFREYQLFRVLPAGNELVRARITRSESLPTTVEQLGPPPPELAVTANRMSPAGIPMFYAALDEKTAVLETCSEYLDDDYSVTLARFCNERSLNLLDLTTLPSPPSQFDGAGRAKRAPVFFLHEVVDDFCKPIERGAAEHVDYVPTKVVTEYVRHHLQSPDGAQVDGIVYNSSRNCARPALVIFANAADCGPRQAGIRSRQPTLVLRSFRTAKRHEVSAWLSA